MASTDQAWSFIYNDGVRKEKRISFDLQGEHKLTEILRSFRDFLKASGFDYVTEVEARTGNNEGEYWSSEDADET